MVGRKAEWSPNTGWHVEIDGTAVAIREPIAPESLL
jgi:hypothetical protein